MNTKGKLVALSLACLVAGTTLADDSLPTADQSSVLNPVTPRIIGGIGIDIEQYPATAALLSTSRVQLDGNLFQAQFCAGSVIAARWVLTAAHCVSDLQGNQVTPGSIQVLTGSSNLNEPVNQPIQVVRVLSHSGYTSVELGNDIALLELEIDAQVQPVPLGAAPVVQDEQAFIAGWGGLNIPSEGRAQAFPTELQGAFVNITPGQSCATRFPIYADYVNDTMICAGVEEGGRDSCQGDSGGPLYRTDPADNSVLSVVGITSWGISCGLAESPGVYTNVASYIDWVENALIVAGADINLPVNDDSASTEPDRVIDESSSDDADAGDDGSLIEDADADNSEGSSEDTDSSDSSSSSELADSNNTNSSSSSLGALTPMGMLALFSLLGLRWSTYRTRGTRRAPERI